MKAAGKYLVLVACSNGDGSGARPANMTKETLVSIRQEEQRRAWECLTGGSGKIIYLNMLDGAVDASQVTLVAEGLDAIYSKYGTVEHYAAANTATTTVANQAPDHLAVANGLKAAVTVGAKRGSKVPRDTSSGGTLYAPAGTDLARCKDADFAYSAFGQKSVPTDWTALRASGYDSRIVLL